MRIFLIAVFVILVDQATKLVVVQNMHLRQSIPLLGDWFKFTFTENPGMAFGLQVGPDGFVAVLAVLATFLVIWYLWNVRDGFWPYTASLALILGGALGNIIDRMFYGVIFDYGPIFQGRVVDFIHVDIGYVAFPDVIPILGGSYISLFPIWNVADMAIVGGVIGVLLFQSAFHRRMEQKGLEKEAKDEHAERQSEDIQSETIQSAEREGRGEPSIDTSQELTAEPTPLGNSATVAGHKATPMSKPSAEGDSVSGQGSSLPPDRKDTADPPENSSDAESQNSASSEHQPEQPRSVPDNSDTL